MADTPNIRPWQAGWPRLALALAPVLLLVVRKHSDLRHPQFWAEDGSIFFVQADSHPWRATFEAYAGYLHLLPRLIAVMGHFLPVFWIPAFYALSSLAAVGLVGWTLLSPRIRLPGAWAATLAIGAIPHQGEVYLNICNLQWILAVGLLALAATDDPVTPAQKSGDGAWLLLCALTGPMIVFFLPFFVWRACRRRSRWSLALLGLALGCGAVQCAHLFGQKYPRPLLVWTPLHEWAAVAHRLFFFGLPFEFYRNEETYAALGGVVVVFCGWACWTRRRILPDVWILLAGGLVLAAAVWYKYLLSQMNLADVTAGDRYFYSERILFVWLVAGLAATGGLIFRRTAVALAVVALIMNAAHFVYPGTPDLDWRHSSESIQRGWPTTVPTPPAPWRFFYPGRPPYSDQAGRPAPSS